MNSLLYKVLDFMMYILEHIMKIIFELLCMYLPICVFIIYS